MPNYSLFAYSSYSERVIVKSTALANLAYACYSLGYTKWIKNKTQKLNIQANIMFPKLVHRNQLTFLFIFVIILFVCFLLIGGRDFFNAAYRDMDANNISGIFPQVWGMLQTFTLVLLIANLWYNDKKVYILIGIIIITLLSVGHRTLPLNLLLVVIYFFYYKYKYSAKTLLLFAFSLFFVLSLIGRFRLSADTNITDVTSTGIGYFNFLEDFIVNSRNLYGLYDYAQSKGITYGVSMMGYILYVIPFAQSLFSSLTGISPNEMRSEIITSVIEGNSSAGLGTHIVGDVYIAFGFIGVMLLFYGLGYFVSWIRSKYYNGEKYAYIIYMILVSGSIFMCRGALFYSLKNIVWAIVIIGLCGLKTHQLEKK